MMEILSKGDFYTEHLERVFNETTCAHTRLTQQLELAINELKQCEVDLFEAEDKFHVLSFYINDAQSLACAKDRTQWMSEACKRVEETLKKIEALTFPFE